MYRLAITAALCAVLSATAACGQGLVERVTGAGRSLLSRSEATVGTVMRTAPVRDSGAREAVLVLDTTIQRRLGCFVLSRADIGRVEMWGTLAAYSYTGETVQVGELDCPVVRRFRARKGGNLARRDFLATHALPILAYALRHYPRAAAHFFPGGSELLPVAAELDTLRAMFEAVGALPPRGDGLARCEAALREADEIFISGADRDPMTYAAGRDALRRYFEETRP